MPQPKQLHRLRACMREVARSEPCGIYSVLQFVSMHIARYLVQAWDVRNTCKHSGAVLPLPSAPVGRGVDGIDAMA
jgi:hypothetical protein